MSTIPKAGQAWACKRGKKRIRYIRQNDTQEGALWRREEYGADGMCNQIQWETTVRDWKPAGHFKPEEKDPTQ